MSWSICLILFFFCPLFASSFEFDLESGKSKCFVQELPPETVMTGDFRALPGYNQYVSIRVLDPEENVIFSDDKIEGSGHFKVQSNSKGGDFSICFKNQLVTGVLFGKTLKRRLELVVRTGVDAVDYGQIATKDNMKPIEVELRRMEDIIQEVRGELEYQREREVEMRNTNESTNFRVAWLSMLSLAVLLCLAAWQTLYIKRFLKKKKII